MKLGITIFAAALAVMACGCIAAAGEINQAPVAKVADQIVMTPAPRIRRHSLAVHPYEPLHPVACEAVLFPRSPLCAGRPAAYGPYATYPYNYYWSY
jgi:hypothetical protein